MALTGGLFIFMMMKTAKLLSAPLVKTFTDPNWNIIDSGTYVIIKSKNGKPVQYLCQ